MVSTSDIDSLLEKAEWEQWREGHARERGVLAEAARAWCTSSYWKEHTPRLECWKTVVGDLGSEGLTEPVLVAMADANEHRLPFPVIPLFEDEQVQDFCRVVRDADAAAALAKRLEAKKLLLDVEPGKTAAKCWEVLPAGLKQGLDFAGWQWKFSGGDGRRIPLLADDAVTEEPVTDSRNARLAAELFEGFTEFGDWEQVVAEACSRTRGMTSAHPLAAMARDLREHDEYPDSLDEAAWGRLEKVFRNYPRLLELDSAEPGAPLPALVLGCAVRSMVTPGIVALGLLPYAGPNKRMEAWWKALAMALRPAVRRGGWGNPNDRWRTAMRAVEMRAARELEGAEAAAMKYAFSRLERGDQSNG